MRTHAQLCHVSSDRCVVLVEAFEGTTPLGSALGEAGTATEAEDQALIRLSARLNTAQQDAINHCLGSTLANIKWEVGQVPTLVT